MLLYSAELAELETIRRAVTRANWGTDTLPNLQPVVTENWTGTVTFKSSYPALASRVDLLSCPVRRGAYQYIHLVHPTTSNGKCVVLHAGHHDHYYSAAGFGMDVMCVALATAGFTVLGAQMPTMGFNIDGITIPIAGEDFTFLSGMSHNFDLAEDDGMKCLRLFLDPTFAAINYAVETLGFPYVDMTGISGGGWTTDWVAALHPYVRRSAPTFGSLPFPLRDDDNNELGDWEQFEERPFWRELESFSLGTEETLYALGACGYTPNGHAKRRLQLLGAFEFVFPIDDRRTEVAAYNEAIQDVVGADRTDVWIDENTVNHDYTAESAAVVIDFFNE